MNTYEENLRALNREIRIYAILPRLIQEMRDAGVTHPASTANQIAEALVDAEDAG